MEKIANKIRKIIAKAEGTNNEAEAQMLMEKAHSLLEQHGLELFQLDLLDDEDPVGVDRGFHEFAMSLSYGPNLAFVLARYYGCECVVHKNSYERRIKLSVAGRQSARITFQLMFPYVMKEIQRLARLGHKNGDFPTYGKGLTATANALVLRLHRLNAERDRNNGLSAKQSNALVPVDAIEAAMKEAFTNLRQGRGRSHLKTSRAGMEAAKNISLNKQTGGSGIKRIGR